MSRLLLCVLALGLLGLAAAPAQADPAVDRAAALDHVGRGVAAFRGGDMVAAMREWSAAIRLSQQARAPEIAAEALARRGEMYRAQGYLRNAAVDLRSALTQAEAIGDERLIAASSGALGNLELTERHVAAAEPLLRRSRDIAHRIGDRKMLAASDNDLGNLYAQTGRPAEAEIAYAAASADAAAAGDETLAAAADTNAARLAVQRNDAAGAQRLLSRAIDRLRHSPAGYSEGMALLSAGSVVLDGRGTLDSRQVQLAEGAFSAAKQTAQLLRNPALLSLAEGSLGKLYARTGRAGDASRLTDRALFAAQRAPAPELSFRWEWQQARLAREQGHAAAALADYRRAVSALESVRQDIPVEYRDGRSSYRVTFGPLYREYADLLLRRATADPIHAAPLIREARNTIERLKKSELQDYFRDSCIAAFEARRQSIETAPPGSAVLYPISLPDRLELLVSIGREERHFVLPVHETELREEVRRFRELLENPTTNEYLVPARQLYDQIIRPIEPFLAANKIDTLVVVPDEILRVVPLGALYDGKQFLVARYATAVAPSLQLVDLNPGGRGLGDALVVGISKGIQGFIELPNVAHEVASVRSMASGDELLNEGFTRKSFGADLKAVPYNLVHIASHGQFSANPKQTFILAYDGKLDMDALESDIKFGERRQNPLELLVLSACETASGDDRAALGLAGVALKAGARSAVASLWQVNDEAAGKLVVDFYHALQSGKMSKAHALQAAQRALASTPQYGHPAYWAPFLLIGNWL